MFASTSCFASDWIVLYIEDMGKTYYDKSSITRCQTAWKNGQGIRENSVENCPP